MTVRGNKNGGYTLMELLITLAVLALLAVVAIPGFEDSISRNARDSAQLELMSSLALARSEAVNAGARAAICRSVDQSSCAGGSDGDWNDGWLVFIDANSDGAFAASDDDVLLRARPSQDLRMTITLADEDGSAISGDFLRFSRDGFLHNTDNKRAYYTFCGPDNDAANARGVLISNTGRASRSVDDGDGVHNDVDGGDLSC